MIKFACDNCGKAMQVPESAAGKKGTCKGCSSVIVVPFTSTIEPIAPTELIQKPTTRPSQTVRVRAAEDYPVQQPAPIIQPVFMQSAPTITQVTQVRVNTGTSRVGCFAVAAVIFGLMALAGSWIPILGLAAIPLAGVGLACGLLGIMVAAIQGDGVGTPFIGVVVSGLAIFVAMASTGAAVAVVGDVSRQVREQEQKRQAERETPIENVAPTAEEPPPSETDTVQVVVPAITSPVAPVEDPTAVSQKNEKTANGKLAMAKSLLSKNKRDAIKRLNEIVEKFDGTPAAKEAAELIEKNQ